MCSLGICREPHFSPMWLHFREPESGQRQWLAPQSLFAQLLGKDLPAALDEMERMRACLLGCCPHPVALGDGEGAKKTRQSSGSLVAPQPSGQGNDSHRLSLDVSGFQPEELTVRLEGRKLTVSGKHKKKSESADGCVCQEYRELHREVLLPEDASLEAVACALTQEGHLRIEAPQLALPPPKETTIPISISKAAQATGEEEG